MNRMQKSEWLEARGVKLKAAKPARAKRAGKA